MAALNAFPAFSLSSTTNGPNFGTSAVTADSGTFLVDVGSSNTTYWVKRSGSTTTGWAPMLLGPIDYPDLPVGSGNWSPGVASIVGLVSSLSVQGKLSVSTALASSYVATATNSAASGVNFGMQIIAGSTAADVNLSLGDRSGNALFTVFGDAHTQVEGPVRLKGYTVASLPSGTTGDIAYATNLLAPTFLTAATGGGSVVGPVFYNGSAWVTI